MSTTLAVCSSASSSSDALGPPTAGSTAASCSHMDASSWSGNLTSNRTYKLPLRKGCEWCGMPSSSTHTQSSCFTTSPGLFSIISLRPSSCVNTILLPHSASTSGSWCVRNRSWPTRLKESCSFWSSWNTTLPGSWLGSLPTPASPRSTMRCPFFMPFSMLTSNTCFSLFSPLERQSPHWSPAATLRPEPLHLRHGCWTCCIMPGPRGRSRTSLPLPRHCAQVAGVPDLEPLPAHVAHLMLRDRLSLRVPPLYISSRVTLRRCWTSSALRSRERPPPPPNMSKMSAIPPPPPPPRSAMPSLMASSPYSSYIFLFSGSLSTSYTWLMLRKVSASPPLSGWCFIAALRWAFFRSAALALRSTPSIS
mmetsp:Transcript_35729/g.91208  ORF Transcript_35729/g.91208 Transcript_35729/m.91208 type:complete len:364 (-) Transcript_35729:221-1312(-)